jgi:hypothetical protein
MTEDIKNMNREELLSVIDKRRLAAQYDLGEFLEQNGEAVVRGNAAILRQQVEAGEVVIFDEQVLENYVHPDKRTDTARLKDDFKGVDMHGLQEHRAELENGKSYLVFNTASSRGAGNFPMGGPENHARKDDPSTAFDVFVREHMLDLTQGDAIYKEERGKQVAYTPSHVMTDELIVSVPNAEGYSDKVSIPLGADGRPTTEEGEELSLRHPHVNTPSAYMQFSNAYRGEASAKEGALVVNPTVELSEQIIAAAFDIENLNKLNDRAAGQFHFDLGRGTDITGFVVAGVSANRLAEGISDEKLQELYGQQLESEAKAAEVGARIPAGTHPIEERITRDTAARREARNDFVGAANEAMQTSFIGTTDRAVGSAFCAEHEKLNAAIEEVTPEIVRPTGS